MYVAPPVRPADDDLQAAADLLNDATKPAILAGVGARGAGPLVELVADVLGAPIVKSLSGKMVVPDDSPFAHRRPRAARHRAQRGPDARSATRC